MIQSTTTSYITTEGGKRMRVDPDNSGPTCSTSAPSQGVARGDAKRRKIDASPDHSGIAAIQSADMPAQPPVSKKKRSKRSRSDDESSDVDPRPTKKSHHDVTLAPRPTNKQPSKRRRSNESSDDESSDAGLRPTKKIQMEDVHAEAEESQNPTVDRNITLGAELPPVQEELSVQFSAHCTSRKFDKSSLPANFLTETGEEVNTIRTGSSLWPVQEEEEACEAEACEEEDVVIPNAMGENEAATKIQALWRGHYHGLPGLNDDEDEEPVAREVRYDVNDLPPAFEDEKSYPDVHPMYHTKHGVQSRAHLKEIGVVRPEPSSQTQEFDTAMIDDAVDENDGLESIDFETAADNASNNDFMEEEEEEEKEEEAEEEEVEDQIAIDDVMDKNDGLESIDFETATDNTSGSESVEVVGAVEEEEEEEEEEVEDQIAIDDVMDENDGLEPVDVETAADNSSDSESVEVVGAVEEEEEEEEEEVEVQQIAPRRPRRKRMLIELQCTLDGRYWSQAATRRCIVRD
eukprot:scaffold15378_cov68-Skeletonema_dohrnii-CCMP3373.AAC.1